MNAIPTVTKNLLIINVLVFLATIVAQSYGLDLARYLGLHFFLADNFNIAQLITYMFMHGGFTHLFFNMFALWMFGRILEQVWGPKRFLLLPGMWHRRRIYTGNRSICTLRNGAFCIHQRQHGLFCHSDGRISQHDDYCRSVGSYICHPAGIRNAVPQPAVIYLPAAIPDQG